MIRLNIRKRLSSADGAIDLVFEGEVSDGELVALFGKSGAGKTTLLRMIAGLTTPDSGTIEVDGRTWYSSDQKIDLPPQRRRVGLLFQEHALFPNMTVRENIGFALSRQERASITRELLETTGLTNLADRKPGSLSHGQRQRVALARALAPRPGVLLLDEPLSALDQAMRGQIQEELLSLQKRFRPATILVSHDLSEVFRLSGRVYVLERGTVERSGTPAEVFAGSGISNKFRVTGEILQIRRSGLVYILTVLVGGDVIRVAATESEMVGLRVGSRVLIASKAFNPIVQKIDDY
jgi:molybdate transport system ATP-binding protein